MMVTGILAPPSDQKADVNQTSILYSATGLIVSGNL